MNDQQVFHLSSLHAPDCRAPPCTTVCLSVSQHGLLDDPAVIDIAVPLLPLFAVVLQATAAVDRIDTDSGADLATHHDTIPDTDPGSCPIRA